MPGIGNPYKSTSNSFSKIKMGQKIPKKKDPNKLGDTLNQMAGIDEKKFFVDAKKHNQIGKDGFLKLLSTQLQNQDPVKPMDQKKFASDLAQFAQLEQMSNVNSKLQQGLDKNNFQDKFYGASFLGKEVITNGTSVRTIGDGSPSTLPFKLPKDAKKVMVRIFDHNRQMIRQIEMDAMVKGQNSIKWDGKAADGYVAGKGEYTFQITGWDQDYNQFKGETKGTGLVTGVTFEGGETMLQLEGGKKVNLRDVQKFQIPKITQQAKKLPTLKNVAQKVYNNNENNLKSY